MSRLGTLNSLATHMNSLVSKVEKSYNIAKETMLNLIVQFQLPLEEQQNAAPSHIQNKQGGTHRRLVRDLVVVRMKGCCDSEYPEPGIQRQLGRICGRCGGWGHYRTTCKAVIE